MSMLISKYEVEGNGLKTPVRIAFLADIHEKNPAPMIEALKEIKPDLILVGGDVFERHDCGSDPKFDQFIRQFNKIKQKRKQIKRCLYLLFRHTLSRNKPKHENAYSFFEQAVEIAPVILSRGNHEWYYAPEDLEVLADCGVTLVDNSYVSWNGLWIGGLSPCFDWHFLMDFEKLEGYKILLCHHPEYYIFLLNKRPFDLVLSGHAHGGQIRIGERGLFSPGQGLFPTLVHGKYYGNMIVTSGCANTAKIPRWGNPVEVVQIDIK